MTIAEDTLLRIRDEYPDLEAEVRGILLARAQEGATIADIKEEYRKINGVPFPVYDNITEFLLSIPSVSAICTDRGTRIFNILPTDKTKHLYEMVVHQKPRSSTSSGKPYLGSFILNNNHNNNNHNNYNNNKKKTLNFLWANSGDGYMENNNNYCFEDNWNYLNNRFPHKTDPPQYLTAYNVNNNNNNYHNNNDNNNYFESDNINQVEKPKVNSKPVRNPFRHPASVLRASSPVATKSSRTTDDTWYTSDSDYEAHLLDFPLLGDDFFLYLARMELKCKFKRCLVGHKNVLQSGLCVSGQTIRAAIRRVRRLDICDKRVIVNIGSVDILQGRSLVQIEHDFRQLIGVMQAKGIEPILTTLAPLANYSHNEQIKNKVERFNEFMKREAKYMPLIDIWACLVNERRQTLFDCFQTEARKVTGAAESYVFWNKIGRQRVLKEIEENLEY